MGIMLLYEENWGQNGNMYYFERCQGKGIEPKKTTTYEELLKIVCHILKVDPTKHNHLMKYVFNGNIPTTPIQLRDDGDVKIFILLNCTNGKLLVPLCITIKKKTAIIDMNQSSTLILALILCLRLRKKLIWT